jgi:hypothetical protein
MTLAVLHAMRARGIKERNPDTAARILKLGTRYH